MGKIANALNLPASSNIQSLTLGNSNNFLGTNTLDCNGSAAFGIFAGIAAPTNGVTIGGFLGLGTANQTLSNSTAEFVMPTANTECNIYFTSYVGSVGSNGTSLILRSARGTASTPTANLTRSTLGFIGGNGYTGKGFTTTSKAAVLFVTTEDWSDTDNGASISFQATRSGTTKTSTIAQVINTAASTSGVAISNEGSGLLIKEGTNARMGRATLVSILLSPSVVTVFNNTVTANTEIFLCSNIPSGGPGILSVIARTAGVSFTISSSAIGDTSVVSWLLIEPSP
ncbi:hypothetical protein RHABOEDO_001877 (plasmid) [Candidatus Rhabdochlamydia oedothoracis]|uniref:K1 capsule-specific polysaccharide lyase C-terminal domain-containing protein n=2 Tax=Candidatus Rhabdochlamydia oedothoracis TaxID=2720720 RepID=A0ABX8V7B5_9BACT|nr:hypothetical protein [Candidatus Rhabdochlamydia sp. W815]KAG6559874.1 hypothetical protein RHOW815_000057 [Candidatus Rhabdochlamydia sp. W815]QYF49482.1 hypothetical protein RHABOEDO_001877 [Candidatus Rhabdochlamydia oedothoracis]